MITRFQGSARAPWLVAVALTVAIVIVAAACSGPPADGLYYPNPPPYEGFVPVADALETRCGTLDCHGNSARNLRVYGIDGIRSGGNVTGNKATTEEEYQKTYSAFVAIQPEILSQIVSQHGARPERWIVITKGRGAEHHKGGSRMAPGDAMDVCITSWLTGVVDQEKCGTASNVVPPGDAGLEF